MNSVFYKGLEVVLIPFHDNVFYVMLRGGEAVVVDPAASEPVSSILRARNVRLTGVLITHRDPDHVAGVEALVGSGVPIRWPAGRDESWTWQGLEIRAIDTPGHRREHTAYYLPDPEPGLLFSGDCLFAGGCGRLFGLPPELMFTSLQRLAALPGSTHVYCGHDYLAENMRFAATVDPSNPDVERRRQDALAARSTGKILLPTTIEIEKKTNPFLRAQSVEEFAILRKKKDQFG